MPTLTQSPTLTLSEERLKGNIEMALEVLNNNLDIQIFAEPCKGFPDWKITLFLTDIPKEKEFFFYIHTDRTVKDLLSMVEIEMEKMYAFINS